MDIQLPCKKILLAALVRTSQNRAYFPFYSHISNYASTTLKPIELLNHILTCIGANIPATLYDEAYDLLPQWVTNIVNSQTPGGQEIIRLATISADNFKTSLSF
jgi:hypothetical protein